MGQDPADSDQPKPRQGLSRRPIDLAVIGGGQDAKDRLKGRQPKEDGDNRLISCQPFCQDRGGGKAKGTACSRQNPGAEVGYIGACDDQDPSKAKPGGGEIG